MKWIVGLDLRPSSQGALRFGAWLKDLCTNQVLDALHVVEGVDTVAFSDLAKPAREATLRTIEEVGAGKCFREVLVRGAEAPEDAIEKAFAEQEVDGIIVGREGASTEEPEDRLGRVSRRLLRRLPGPVIVTRPELVASEMHSGAIVVCADLDGDATPALRFAMRLGESLKREVVVAHVIRKVYEQPIVYMPAENWAPRQTSIEADAKEKLAAWLASQGAQGVRTCIDEGPVIRRLLGVAATEEACMIVCGARKVPGDGERNFLSSTGADLAAVSRIPIAVVPSDYE